MPQNRLYVGCKMQKAQQNATPTNGGWDVKMPCFLGKKIFSALARYLHYIGIEKESLRKKERELDMYGIQKSTSVNGFLDSLPRIVEKKIWKVTDTDGTVVQYCSASDNLKRTAQKYIDGKYPGRTLKLTFVGCRGYITIPR